MREIARHLGRNLPPPDPNGTEDCIHCRAAAVHEKRVGQALRRTPTDNIKSEVSLKRAADMADFRWRPASQADIDDLDPEVLDLYIEILVGQRQRERDETPGTSKGRRVGGYDPAKDPERAEPKADAI
jgi:hypothetical protein